MILAESQKFCRGGKCVEGLDIPFTAEQEARGTEMGTKLTL